MGKLVRGLDNALFMYGGGGTDSSFFSNQSVGLGRVNIDPLLGHGRRNHGNLGMVGWTMDGATIEILYCFNRLSVKT
jgi:hypothetical protein